MKNIYICGPVSDRPLKEVVEHFTRNEQRILDAAEKNKVSVLTYNPMRFCLPSFDWLTAMRVCVRELSHCHGIALLQGWQQPRGAALELKLAQDLHIPVIYVEQPVDYISLDELFRAAPETLRYYNTCLTSLHNIGIEESFAENKAILELTNRYLDPYGFEYI